MRKCRVEDCLRFAKEGALGFCKIHAGGFYGFCRAIGCMERVYGVALCHRHEKIYFGREIPTGDFSEYNRGEISKNNYAKSYYQVTFPA